MCRRGSFCCRTRRTGHPPRSASPPQPNFHLLNISLTWVTNFYPAVAARLANGTEKKMWFLNFVFFFRFQKNSKSRMNQRKWRGNISYFCRAESRRIVDREWTRQEPVDARADPAREGSAVFSPAAFFLWQLWRSSSSCSKYSSCRREVYPRRLDTSMQWNSNPILARILMKKKRKFRLVSIALLLCSTNFPGLGGK